MKKTTTKNKKNSRVLSVNFLKFILISKFDVHKCNNFHHSRMTSENAPQNAKVNVEASIRKKLIKLKRKLFSTFIRTRQITNELMHFK